MTRRLTFILTLAALQAWGQTPPPTVYVSAQYLKWKPGMAEEGRAFHTQVANKVAVARNNAGGKVVGQARLYRVFPSAQETGHDTIRLVFQSGPPDLGATAATPAALLAGMGLTPEEYGRKLNAIAETVKSEIWADVFRHGSMNEGDFVRINYVAPPKDSIPEYVAHQRDYSGGMADQLVKSGRLKGWDCWRLLLTPNPAPYNFLSVTVHKDSASVLTGLGKQTDAFYAAHPKGDYNLYFNRGRELANTVKTVVYRVNSAIWK